VNYVAAAQADVHQPGTASPTLASCYN